MQVFKYLLRVRKYLIIVYNNHPMKKICIFCAHIRPTWLCELSEDQRHMFKIFGQPTSRGWNPNECKFINMQYLGIDQ